MKTATAKNIDEYIAGFPRDVQQTLQKIRGIIRDAAPDAQEAIKYRMPTFVLHGNLVHFAGFEKHIGFLPNPIRHRTIQQRIDALRERKRFGPIPSR